MTSLGVEPKIKVISFHLHAGHLLYEVTKNAGLYTWCSLIVNYVLCCCKSP